MAEMERLRARLDNIQAVEPILSALRSISSGTRLLALKNADSVKRYQQDLARIVALILGSLPGDAPPLRERRSGPHKVQLLAIGSERGLCGAFNEALVASADQLQRELTAGGARVGLWVLGARAERAFRSRGIEPAWSGHLSLTALPSLNLAHGLVSRWLRAYTARQVDAVEVVYNRHRGLASYEPGSIRLLPPELPVLPEGEPDLLPLVETDPQHLLWRALKLWLSAKLHAVLLDSAAAEHTVRYQLMDGAAENAQRLIEELELFLQVARQQAITSEMQDLASGAGLLTPLHE